MPTYTVVKPMRGTDGRTVGAGQKIELTARQAKYLLLSGKIMADLPKTKTAATAQAGEKTKKEK